MDLVERLRNIIVGEKGHPSDFALEQWKQEAITEAADRIEALEAAITYAAETTNDKHTSRKLFEALGQTVEYERMMDNAIVGQKYVVRYDDGGERLAVSFDKSSPYFTDQVTIRTNEADDSAVYVNFTDVRWLAATLAEIADLVSDQ